MDGAQSQHWAQVQHEGGKVLGQLVDGKAWQQLGDGRIFQQVEDGKGRKQFGGGRSCRSNFEKEEMDEQNIYSERALED